MAHPNNVAAAEEESKLFQELNSALEIEADMKRQQHNEKWKEEGDSNTIFFHDAIKVRHTRKNIISISDDDGNVQSIPENIDKAFMNHFSNLFGNSIDFSPGLYLLNTLNLPTITYSDATALTRKATDDEIKRSLFAMNHHSFSGPDGLTVGFFTSTWTIIGPYFCKAVHNFFDKCKLLREVNTTNIALIPKTSHPSSMSSFRSIS